MFATSSRNRVADFWRECFPSWLLEDDNVAMLEQLLSMNVGREPATLNRFERILRFPGNDPYDRDLKRSFSISSSTPG